MFDDMKKFKGDFTSLWKLDVLPPIPRLSWWWWWVIIYIRINKILAVPNN